MSRLAEPGAGEKSPRGGAKPAPLPTPTVDEDAGANGSGPHAGGSVAAGGGRRQKRAPRGSGSRFRRGPLRRAREAMRDGFPVHQADTPEEHYARVEQSPLTILRSGRIGGGQCILGALLALAIMPLVPPDELIGNAGIALALALALASITLGVRLLRASSLSVNQHLAVVYAGVLMIGGVSVLAADYGAPYTLLYIFSAGHLGLHPLRRGMPVFALAIAFIFAPAAFSGFDGTTMAVAIMLTATLALFASISVWLVGRAYADVSVHRDEARRLQELDQIKDWFVSSVSHELRTPLTSVKGYVEALLAGEAGPLNEEQREACEATYRNAIRLEQLTVDLLILARIDSGSLALERSGFDLASSLGRLCEEHTLSAGNSGIEIRIDVPASLTMNGDRVRLEQVFSNLIENAIKYSDEQGVVFVQGLAKAGGVVVEVSDLGVGIPPAEIEQLGERFFRASTAAERPGTGLGLAISREIVMLHGGWLEVESELGVGSTFRVGLPRELGTPAIAAPPAQAD